MFSKVAKHVNRVSFLLIMRDLMSLFFYSIRLLINTRRFTALKSGPSLFESLYLQYFAPCPSHKKYQETSCIGQGHGNRTES